MLLHKGKGRNRLGQSNESDEKIVSRDAPAPARDGGDFLSGVASHGQGSCSNSAVR